MELYLKRAVIKEELVMITGCYISALILNQFLYWSERTRDTDKYLKEEMERQRRAGDIQNTQPLHGWVYKTAEELSDELMLRMAPNTIRKYTKQLTAAGFLDERVNPRHKWDKTLQYRPNINRIQSALRVYGCQLEGYGVITSSDTLSLICRASSDERFSSMLGDYGAIPETTTEITTEEKKDTQLAKVEFEGEQNDQALSLPPNFQQTNPTTTQPSEQKTAKIHRLNGQNLDSVEPMPEPNCTTPSFEQPAQGQSTSSPYTHPEQTNQPVQPFTSQAAELNPTNLSAINGHTSSPSQPNDPNNHAFQANQPTNPNHLASHTNYPQQLTNPPKPTTSRFEDDLDAESIITAKNAINAQGAAKSAASSPSLAIPATANLSVPTAKRQSPAHLRRFEAMHGNDQQDQIAQHFAQKLGGKASEFEEVGKEYNGIDDPLPILERVVEVALFMRGSCKPVSPKKLAADATAFVLDGYTLEQAKTIMDKGGQYRLDKKLRDDPYPSQIRTWLLSNGTLPAQSTTAEQGEVSQQAIAFHAKYAASGMNGSNMPESAKQVFRAIGVTNPSERMRLTPAQIQGFLLPHENYGL